jgi:hypothetical protein
MFRWTRRILTLISFFLFAESLALWARSYALVDFVHHEKVVRSGQTLLWDQRRLTNWQGRVSLGVKHVEVSLPHPDWSEQEIARARNGWNHDRFDGNQLVANYHGLKTPGRFGFGRQKIDSKSSSESVQGWLVLFPWWAPVLLSGILPFFGLLRFFKARRRLKRLAALNYNGMQTRKLAA